MSFSTPDRSSASLAEWLSSDFSSLVPEDYASYRPLIRNALLFFFARLPVARRLEILDAAQELGDDASLVERVLLLLRLCPTLHKLGQVVSRDRRLSVELRSSLQTLEVLPPSLAGKAVATLLEEELGELRDVTLATEPLAEASVAIVLPFTWHRSTNSSSRASGSGLENVRGVFKLLKPGIEERLHEELEIWSELGSFLETECRRLGLATPDYRDAVDRIRELLAMEVRLDQEQENLRLANRSMARSTEITLPQLLPFCSARVTAMTRIDGCKITEATSRRPKLANLLVESLIARPLLQAKGRALFHADPHAGNLSVTDQGKLAIYDWALVGELKKNERVQITQILLGAMTLNPRRIGRAVERLASTAIDRDAAAASIHASLARLRRGSFPGVDWLFGLLDDLAFQSKVRFPGDLILFRKSLLTLRGVIEELQPGFPLERTLARETIAQTFRDWPRRWLTHPLDRSFGTHLSNADLLRLMGSGPATVRRFLTQSLSRRTLRGRKTPAS